MTWSYSSMAASGQITRYNLACSVHDYSRFYDFRMFNKESFTLACH